MRQAALFCTQLGPRQGCYNFPTLHAAVTYGGRESKLVAFQHKCCLEIEEPRTADDIALTTYLAKNRAIK